ncbi:MAG: 4-hydroxy-3-methylbut-2-en-1-yl diphosphate synthase, partial [Prevotella sp.]
MEQICIDLFNYMRRTSGEVAVGNKPLGGGNDIRIQSMTTTPTADIEASALQAERIADAGGEYVRLTTQGVREAECLKDIAARLAADGYDVPLVADVHFNPNVADVAALHAAKVRINPGNYVDPARTFRQLEYTDEEYAGELKKIEQRFVPFLDICRKNGTAVRIGVNHGSLSDRIMSRYGDTPEGIVESCMEFLRICKRERFDNVVISIKASNTVVMVRSVRLLAATMESEDMHYPLHLGVTEAGEGEDGRIKSAVGIGALLCDGIGDTIRVSLSEEPEAEIPVARRLVDYITKRTGHTMIPALPYEGFCYTSPERRRTTAVDGIGGANVPVVIMTETKHGKMPVGGDRRPEYIYVGSEIPENMADGMKYIADFSTYMKYLSQHADATDADARVFPIFPHTAMPFLGTVDARLKFLVMQYGVNVEEYVACLKHHPEVVVVCMSHHRNKLGEQRALIHEMTRNGLKNPVVICQMYRHSADEKSDFQLEAAADMGALMFDGLCDGIWLMNDGTLPAEDICDTAFGILQAARLRTSKTEYISCPGCGRTLYDLRSTIARIKEATAHMKGLKIGIM